MNDPQDFPYAYIAEITLIDDYVLKSKYAILLTENPVNLKDDSERLLESLQERTPSDVLEINSLNLLKRGSI